MTISLLRTKLYISPIRSELVSRPRLIERLDSGRHSRLTLLSAPAGFGKTTLLSEWVTRFRDRAAWLSLDQEDNDGVRFWTYLIAALQTVQASLGQDARRLLRAPQQLATQVVLTSVLNQVAALTQELVLVLDDYHLISDPAVHKGLAFLLGHLPPQMHVVISTRADPPLPTHRLRARGQLTELRSDDLRFTADEAAAFLNVAMELDLAREDVEALEARTEGWIVGLQLAALSLQGRGDAHEFIAAFSGGHHYVLEYLTEEVVRRQPEPVQRFLMQTSILDSLCGPLCDAVRFGEAKSPEGETDGEAMLAYLQQRNLFILPLDDEHRWYRYHHLFADLLGNLLRKALSAESIRELHLRACEWCEQNGMTAEAVNHALAAQDFRRTALLIEEHSLAMVTRGELTTLLRRIEALPEEIAHSHPLPQTAKQADDHHGTKGHNKVQGIGSQHRRTLQKYPIPQQSAACTRDYGDDECTHEIEAPCSGHDGATDSPGNGCHDLHSKRKLELFYGHSGSRAASDASFTSGQRAPTGQIPSWL